MAQAAAGRTPQRSRGNSLMPAMITHYLFAQRVFAKCRQAGIPVVHPDAALIGAQGPDIFFFHRVMPWQRGVSYARQGSLLHKRSPARLFEAFREVLNRESGQRDQMPGICGGLFLPLCLGSQRSPLRLLLAGEAASGGAGLRQKGKRLSFPD